MEIFIIKEVSNLGVSNIRPRGQNQITKIPIWSCMTFENTKNVKFWTECIFISFHADKELPHCYSYYTKVIKQ